MKLGFIGLGKMGSRMVVKLSKENHEVIVWNRSKEPIESIKYQVLSIRGIEETLKIASSIEDLVKQLQPPRIVWLMLPAGDATESILENLKPLLEKEDIVIDGGNAHFRDTEDRFKQFKNKGIRFLGIGVSGGIIAEKNGYPLMVGGDKSAYEHIIPILDSLARPARNASNALQAGGGHEYFGEGGAGHFVKMVHNGIEYGFMQSLGEGFGVLEKSEYKFNLLKVAKLYQKGTLVSGFMLDRAVEVFSHDEKLDNVVGIIEESGEAKWTVEEAESEQVPVPIIKGSLDFRRQSQTDPEVQQSFAAKLVAALRNAFGGHEVKKK